MTGRETQTPVSVYSENVSLTSPQGIFKPQNMNHVLSIRTGYPKDSDNPQYKDQVRIRKALLRDDDLEYDFREDPDMGDNLRLRDVCMRRIPVIWFLGMEPASSRGPVRYHAIVPTYIVEWNPDERNVKLFLGPRRRVVPHTRDRPPRYSRDRPVYRLPTLQEHKDRIREVKVRDQQRPFREKLLRAYKYSCAICRLPDQNVLDACHIKRYEDGGSSEVSNGLLLCKNHHAAFDRWLIGIDSQFVLHSDHLDTKGHRWHEELKEKHGTPLNLPRLTSQHPSPALLGERFLEFQGELRKRSR